MYKNGMQVPESQWYYSGGSLSGNVGVIGSRIVVSYFLEIFLTERVAKFEIAFLQIFHMDAGDTLDLRMTEGNYIKHITLNIELIGLGFDYLV